ncbi:unnamed protein product [Nippostrongylus brasiliensis]|uniref:ANK_REP_REGION domain-containing protein n=1 Tax=Nippostrongylus brasiliensis TaxID=27835 RepID=A0A0N4Y7F1_NIPBR|nr:unnamed protein product [Nippostrongylus brasiliensis]
MVQALAPTVDVDAVPAALDYGEETETVDIDVNKEVTLEELRTMSLEDVCLKMAHCAHASLSDSVSAGRSSSWYRNMVKNCQEAIDSHDFPRPSLPVEVERKLDQLCDVEDENYRAEKERNSRKFFRRNARLMSDGGDAFECVYPVAKTDVLDQPLLLAGISGNAKLFFKLVLEKTHFITKVLSPGNEVEQWDKSTKAHYERMVERWVQGTTTTAGSKMCPFDMAVYYDDVSSAKALLNSQKCVNFVRFRKGDLSTPNSSLPLATYIKYQLIQPRHYPQAFREAANAGDLDMLHRLWLMCGERQECIVETCTTAGRKMCTPLHIACAAGHLSCVQFLCLNQELRKTMDSVGDLPIVYAIENGHTAITKYFIESFPAEIPHAVIKSAINCRNNHLAKLFLHDMLNLAERIVEIKPMKFAVEVGNFHMAEYILRLYVGYKKVCETPWLDDVQEALRAVLCCNTLAPKEKAKFVVAFQLAGVKVHF